MSSIPADFRLAETRIARFPAPPKVVICDLEADFDEFKKRLRMLGDTLTFDSLENTCQGSRVLFGSIQNAYLFCSDSSAAQIEFQRMVDSFIELVEEGTPQIDDVVHRCKGTAHQDSAAAYRESIQHRRDWAKILRRDGLVALYSAFLRFTKTEQPGNTQSLLPSTFVLAGKRSVSSMRSLFARNALAWLIHKSAFIAAELAQEHGPYLECAKTHYQIVKTIAECVRCLHASSSVEEIVVVLNSDEECDATDDAEPFLRIIGSLIQRLESKVVHPLDELQASCDEVAHGNQQQATAELGIRDCERAIRRIRDHASWALQEIDNRSVICTGDSPVQLSILVYPERGQSLTRMTVAHCLNFDLVTSATTQEVALVQLRDLIEYQLADWQRKRPVQYAKPVPSPFLYVDCWNSASEFTGGILAGEKWTGTVRIFERHPLTKVATSGQI